MQMACNLQGSESIVVQFTEKNNTVAEAFYLLNASKYIPFLEKRLWEL